MKKPADDLFQLIKSLTQAEKRYFKVHAGKQVKGHSNKYEKLFDAYDALPDDKPYDEAAFKRTLRGKSYGKNLAQEKQYLQESLMETLRAFHAEGSIDNQLYQLLAEEDIYRQKRLNNLREKTIEKAKEIARKYEKWEVLLMLLDREISLRIELNSQTLGLNIVSLRKDLDQVLKNIHLIAQLKSISDEIFVIYRVRKQYKSDAIAELFKKLEIIEYMPGVSFFMDLYYLRTHDLYFRLCNNLVKHNAYSSAVVELYEGKYPHFIDINPRGYVIAIFNYLNSCHTIRSYSTFKQSFEKVKKITIANKDMEGEVWQNIIHLHILQLLSEGKYGEMEKLGNEFENGLSKFGNKVNKAREATIRYNLLTGLFLNEKWELCLKHINYLLDEKFGVRQDLLFYCELINLIVHSELKNYELLIHQKRNWISKMKKANLYSDVESLLLDFLTNKAEGKRDKMTEAARMIIEFYSRPPNNSIVCKMDELKLWIQRFCN